jgi:hypothetical protein
LGCAYSRYRKDKRIENELFKLFYSKNNKIKYTVSVWTKYFENIEKYDYVFETLEKAKSKELIEALCCHFGLNSFGLYVENNIKNKMQKILLDKLETITNEYSVKKIIETLVFVRNEENIPILKKYLETGNEEIKEIFRIKIKMYVPKDENEELLQELNIK